MPSQLPTTQAHRHPCYLYKVLSHNNAPLSPSLAKTLIHLSGDKFSKIACTVEQRTTIAAQQLTTAHTHINHLTGALETRDKEICHLQA